MKTTAQIFFVLNGLLLSYILTNTALNYASLPETVPLHYGSGGTPDGWGSKKFIWLECGVAAAMYMMINYFSAKGNWNSKPETIVLKKEVRKPFFQITNFIVMLIFAVMSYKNTHAVDFSEKQTGLTIGLLLVVIYMAVIFFLAYSSLKKNNEIHQ